VTHLAGKASLIGGFNINGAWSSHLDDGLGSGFVVKDINNKLAGVIGWQHASDTGYLIHWNLVLEGLLLPV
jgi:hypothetical protein